jgi:hypothetical protein
MLLALTVLLLTPPQATATTATPADDAPAGAQTVAKEESPRNSFLLAARPIRPVLPQRREEQVAYLPGQLELHPVISASAAGSDSESLMVATAPPPAPVLLERPRMSPAQKRMWIGLIVASHSAAAFDAWSTRRAISSGAGEELNPTLKPFAHSGALYVVTQASPALMDYIGHRMARSQNRWVRRMWWVPQTAGMAVSITAGIHNTRLVQ